MKQIMASEIQFFPVKSFLKTRKTGIEKRNYLEKYIAKAALVSLFALVIQPISWAQDKAANASSQEPQETTPLEEAPIEKLKGDTILNIESHTLSNGLEVLVLPHHRAPVVMQMLWYKVGGADDPFGQSGIAHFLEHLLFKGTKKFPKDTFVKTVSRYGGQQNAFTSEDTTAYYQTIEKEQLPKIMEMEADRMKNLLLPDEEFETEKQVVIEERRQRIENSAEGLLSEAYTNALYRNSAYGIPVIGWMHEIEALSREEVLAFYKRWYAPNNAVLLIAGDVDPEEVYALAEKYYGPIPKTTEEDLKRFRATEPPHKEKILVQKEDARAQAEFVLKTSFINEEKFKNTPLFREALTLGLNILAGGDSSLLYRKLVVDEAKAAFVGKSQRRLLSGTTLSFYIYPNLGVSVEEAEEALMTGLQEILAEGLSEKSLVAEKRRLIDVFEFSKDSLSSFTLDAGNLIILGESLDDIQGRAQRIESVTLEQVSQALNFALTSAEPVTAILKRPPQEAQNEEVQDEKTQVNEDEEGDDPKETSEPSFEPAE